MFVCCTCLARCKSRFLRPLEPKSPRMIKGRTDLSRQTQTLSTARLPPTRLRRTNTLKTPRTGQERRRRTANRHLAQILPWFLAHTSVVVYSFRRVCWESGLSSWKGWVGLGCVDARASCAYTRHQRTSACTLCCLNASVVCCSRVLSVSDHTTHLPLPRCHTLA